MTHDNAIPVPPYDPNTTEASFAAASQAPANIPFAMPSTRFTKREWAIFACAIAEAFVSMLAFYPDDIFDELFIPGIAQTLFTLIALVIACILIGREGRFDRVTIPLIIATVLLALIPTFFADEELRAFNGPVLLATFSLTVFMVSRTIDKCRVSIKTAAETVAFFFTSLFTNWLRPWKALSRSNRQPRDTTQVRQSRGVLAGIGIAVIALIIIIPLLASADEVFGSLFEKIAEWIADLKIDDIFWRFVWIAVSAPFLFGLLWGAVHGRDGGRIETDGPTDALSASLGRALKPGTLIIVLAAINVVYLIFTVVQFIYLFGGAEAAAMQGGYAYYARNGFFQLVVVAIINLFAGLIAAQHAHILAHANKRPALVAVRILAGLLIVFTAVILASAFMRMQLYIDAYGLTVDRMLTLLGMTFTAVLLVGLAVKLFYEKMNYFALFVVAGLVLWIAFNYCNVDARVANYNIDRFIANNEKHLDLSTLDYQLGPEAIPALEKLQTYLEENPQLSLEDVDPDYYYSEWNFADRIDLYEAGSELFDKDSDDYYEEDPPAPPASTVVEQITQVKRDQVRRATWRFWCLPYLQ